MDIPRPDITFNLSSDRPLLSLIGSIGCGLRTFPDTLVARLISLEEQVVVYSDLIGSCQGIREFGGRLKREKVNIKLYSMQRLAIVSFIGIIGLLLASTAHESGMRSTRNKTGGAAVTYVTAKPPVNSGR